MKESGAFRGGMREGDQIVALQGKTIRSFSDLKLALLHQKPGDTVSVKVKSHTGSARDLDVILQ